MRNLKKILALVLALVMSLSLMAVASADDELNLGDVSDVYAESVDVLTGLKVFQGNKGEFLPKTNITRAEVAAIIYRIVTGDVSDTQKSIYADYNKFSDVTSDAWYAGYVNYCANAEYVKGVGGGKFAPQQNVTGYEALAMILRAIGYDKNNEFTGSNWQIQTAATARNRGLLVNIAEGTLGGAATREVVAEILCKTILVPVADYSLAFGYRTTDANGKDNETLAYKTFKMEKIDGVVVANEYANLETQTTLGAGQTKLVTSAGDYTMNVASTLDDIGESRYVYVRPQTGSTRYDLVCSKVYETEGMNKVYESVNKEDIKDAKFNTVTGMTKDASTEQYINFGPSTNWTSDWRIRYVVSLNVAKASVTPANAADVANINRVIAELSASFALPVYATSSNTTISSDGKVITVPQSDGTYILTLNDAKDAVATITYSKEFTIKADITPTHQGNIERIFNVADRNYLTYTTTGGYVISNDGYLVGEVYVGTTSLEDVSDKMSFEQFKTTYINTDDQDNITANENGNWLKVIDNNNDNVADYVLKVVYTFAQVTAVDADGKATLDTKNVNLASDPNSSNHSTGIDNINNLTTQPVVCADELAVGNIVYYAVIDDKAQTYVPEMVSAKVEKVDRVNLEATTTEGTTYKQSGVHEHIANPELEAGVQNLSGTYTYDMYLDRGGHLAVFTHNPTSTFTLLTNGWYNQQRGGVEYAALAYIDGKQVDTDITAGGSLFIGPNSLIQNNNWNAIKALGGSTGALNNSDTTATLTRTRTAVAFLSGDGSLVPVDRVYNNYVTGGRTIRMIDLDDNLVPNTNGAFYGDLYQTAINANTAYDTKINSGDGVITGSATASRNGKVELRALSNTVYYYVYPTGTVNTNGTTNYVVDMYTGYGSAPSVPHSAVEDVYAVGTLTSRSSGLVYDNNAYYMANVVVVELNSTYDRGGEQIFIYDTPDAHTTVGIETIKYISYNGEDKTAEVDLSRSGTTGDRNYLSAYGRVIPGLYYMYPTTTENVYTIEKMTNADIAANNYAVGQSVTENSIGWDNWVQLQKWASTNGGAAAVDGSSQYQVGANSGIYKLSYSSWRNNANYGHDFSATLTPYTSGSALEALYERESKTGFDITKGIVEHGPWAVTPDTTYHKAANCNGGTTNDRNVVWNHNDLLIAYSGSTIRYAISFANFDADRAAGTATISGNPAVLSGQNYAQDIWQSLVPDSTTQALPYDISFYEGEDNPANTNMDRRTITVPYDAAKGNLIVVKNADRTVKTVNIVSDPQNLIRPNAAGNKVVNKNAWGDEWTIDLVNAPTTGGTVTIDVVDTNNRNTTYTLTLVAVTAPQLFMNDARLGSTGEVGTGVGKVALPGMAPNWTIVDYLKAFSFTGNGKAVFTFTSAANKDYEYTMTKDTKPSDIALTPEMAADGVDDALTVAGISVEIIAEGDQSGDTYVETEAALVAQAQAKAITAVEAAVKAALESKGLTPTQAEDMIQNDPATKQLIATMTANIKSAKTRAALAAVLGKNVSDVFQEGTSGSPDTAKDITISDLGDLKMENEDGTPLNPSTEIDKNENVPATQLPAADANGVITLTKDVNLSETRAISANTTIDMNGKTITAPGAVTFTVAGGSELVLKNGTVDASKVTGVPSVQAIQVANGGKLTIESDATVKVPVDGSENHYAVFLGNGNYNAVVTIKGTIEGEEGIYVSGNNSAVPAGSVASKIILDGAKITTGDMALYQAGIADTTITGNTVIRGAKTGLEIRNGSLTVESGDIDGAVNPSTSIQNGNGSTTVGCGIAIAPHSTNPTIVVNIKAAAKITGSGSGIAVKAVNPATARDFTSITVDVEANEYLTKDTVKNYITAGSGALSVKLGGEVLAPTTETVPTV